MHELSIAEGVLDIVRAQARREGFRAVREVRLEIGRLAAVEPEALRFCFAAVVRGSVAEGARLEIVETPGSAWCFDCMASVKVDSRADGCARCGGARLQVSGGTGMRVMDLVGV
jgi:hydrogenase nickel incorporation protein HypA/HybF